MTSTPRPAAPAARHPGFRRAPVAVVAVLVVVAVVAAGVLLTRSGQDSGTPGSAPYTDPVAVGRLTLCDDAGTAVTAGSTVAQPFAATVVGSTGVPGASGPVSTVLYAYQPRVGVGSGEWTGLLLTAPSTSRAAHPTVTVSAQATTLAQFVAGYPATDDGFIQLRLVAGTTDQPASSYDALDLHIDGDRWTAVDPGDPAACSPSGR